MSTTPIPSFGILLKRFRTNVGLAQTELAEHAGMSRGAISALERGLNTRPRKDTVRLLASALGLSDTERTAFVDAARAGARRAGDRLDASQIASEHADEPLLIGRASELRAIERHLAPGGDPTLLVFTGDPGIGKSRLLHEAAEQARAAGWAVVAGGCTRRSRLEPYAPFAEALAHTLKGKRARDLRRQLVGCAWLTRLLPELLETNGVEAPSQAVSPTQERRLMCAAVARYLSNLAGPAGTLLILDDLQWAGADALHLLLDLVRSPLRLEEPNLARLRIVAAYRDTEVTVHDPLTALIADLVRNGTGARVGLGPLTTAEAETLQDNLLATGARMGNTSWPVRDIPLDQREALLRQAEGIPFYIVSGAEGLLASAVADDHIPRRQLVSARLHRTTKTG